MRNTRNIIKFSKKTSDCGYIDLNRLSQYSSCSVRWLRSRLIDIDNPLPHFRIKGKVLIRKEEFDLWMMNFHETPSRTNLEHIVDEVLEKVIS